MAVFGQRYPLTCTGPHANSGRRVERAPHIRTFTYAVVAIRGTWHLQTHWWDRERYSDRRDYRVESPDRGVYELYRDQVSD